VEQELLTLPENLSSPPVLSGVCVTRSLVLYVCLIDRCLSFCTFSLVLSVLVMQFVKNNNKQMRNIDVLTQQNVMVINRIDLEVLQI
jgi:membrane-anchored protein YejM (alkaline phosphatase superfamily)